MCADFHMKVNKDVLRCTQESNTQAINRSSFLVSLGLIGATDAKLNNVDWMAFLRDIHGKESSVSVSGGTVYSESLPHFAKHT